jgi:large subunit ribosomal protein L23
MANAKTKDANKDVTKIDNVILYPLSTEKSMRLIESENKLVFVVDINADKADVKAAVEGLFNVKVEKVNVLINRSGKKQAFVKLAAENSAADVATDLGIM